MGLEFRGQQYNTPLDLDMLRESDPAAYRDLLKEVQSGSPIQHHYEDMKGARSFESDHEMEGMSFAQLEMFQLCLHEIGIKHKEHPKENYLVGRVKSSGELKVYKKGVKAFFLRLFGVVAFRDLSGSNPQEKGNSGLNKLNNTLEEAVKKGHIRFIGNTKENTFGVKVRAGARHLFKSKQSELYSKFPTSRPDFSRLTEAQLMQRGEKAASEYGKASKVLEWSNGAKFVFRAYGG